MSKKKGVNSQGGFVGLFRGGDGLEGASSMRSIITEENFQRGPRGRGSGGKEGRSISPGAIKPVNLLMQKSDG